MGVLDTLTVAKDTEVRSNCVLLPLSVFEREFSTSSSELHNGLAHVNSNFLMNGIQVGQLLVREVTGKVSHHVNRPI